MPQINVTLREGDVMTVEAEVGVSAMENMREGEVDEILALCGGCMSCATCHVYVDDAFFPKVSEISDDENALLDSSGVRRPTSRLSCQIEMTDDLDGIGLTIAPE